MKKFNSSMRKIFFFALFLSIMFPVGVLAIIFGAINTAWWLLIIGIVFGVLGFYVMPILWVKFGSKRADKFFLSLIYNDNIYTVDGLCAQTGKNRMEVVNTIKRLIQDEYLQGFLFVNSSELVLNENKKQVKKTGNTSKCPNCGAVMEEVVEGNSRSFVCSYCGYKHGR